ncbi:MAG: hypothetical protein OEY59_07965 [Deltaproteobacteria bacterium]|nr:hypothetical protein [Deltaproteobacteria bacterium]
MKTTIILFTLLLAFYTPSIFAEADCMGNACMPQEAQESCIENRSFGCIDWTNGVVYSTGMGVPSTKANGSAQKRFSAITAAEVVAKRNLLQMIEETNITSTTTVKMGMLENDEINTQITGKIKQVEKIDQKVLSDGSVVVTMKMYLRDIMSVLYNHEQALSSSPDKSAPATQTDTEPAKIKAEATPAEKQENSIYGGDPETIYTGLIIDARGTGVKPVMSPKVYDSKDIEVYGSAQVARDFALKQGIAGYQKGLDKAKANPRVKGRPLIIKASLKPGNKSSDLIIQSKDADLLRQVEKTQSFLREARVLILIG